MNRVIKIYTDGACSGNPGPGGLAYIILNEQEEVIEEFSKYFSQTTNNRMELLSVILSLKRISGLFSAEKDIKIFIYSDSQYVINAINKGWLKKWEEQNWKNKKNIDLWQEFLIFYKKFDITFTWIKGHDDNFFNQKCDLMARKAIKR